MKRAPAELRIKVRRRANQVLKEAETLKELTLAMLKEFSGNCGQTIGLMSEDCGKEVLKSLESVLVHLVDAQEDLNSESIFEHMRNDISEDD